MNQLQRTTVHSAPDSWTVHSLACASGSPHAAAHSQLRERLDVVVRAGEGEVGIVGEVDGRHAVEGLRPRGAVLPVEERS
jgi:hypothetical protein